MTTYHATWLANVTGMDGSVMPVFSRIGTGSAYAPADIFVVGWHEPVDAEHVDEVPEIMWMYRRQVLTIGGARFTHCKKHGLPCARDFRSMCMGDVVVVGEVAYACELRGYRRLDEGPRTVLRGTLLEYLEATRAG